MAEQVKLCECGCGNPTPLATQTRISANRIKGQPTRFIRGHIGKINSLAVTASKFTVTESGEILRSCSRCKEAKPILQYSPSKHTSDGYRSHCHTCNRVSARADYKKNSEPYLKRAGEQRDKVRGMIRERMERIKRQYGCQVCSEKEICCLDFHHVSLKKRNLGGFAHTPSFEKELVKCVVLCANCHRKTHAELIAIPLAMLCKAEDCRAAETYGPADLYLGDDGLVYHFPG